MAERSRKDGNKYRDDKHGELVLEERQFADSLISEHVIFFNRGASTRPEALSDSRHSLYVKTDYIKRPAGPQRSNGRIYSSTNEDNAIKEIMDLSAERI